MKFSFQSESALADDSSPAALDLVVPVTTPEVTRASIQAAECLTAGLNAEIRLLKIQLVPFPLPITAPPLPIGFLRQQMDKYASSMPLKREIKLTRDFESALVKSLHSGSVVLIGSKRRRWRTQAGYPVILTFGGNQHA